MELENNLILCNGLTMIYRLLGLLPSVGRLIDSQVILITLR